MVTAIFTSIIVNWFLATSSWSGLIKNPYGMHGDLFSGVASICGAWGKKYKMAPPCEKILFFGWPLKRIVIYKNDKLRIPKKLSRAHWHFKHTITLKTNFQAHHSILYQQNPIFYIRTLPILYSKEISNYFFTLQITLLHTIVHNKDKWIVQFISH